MAHTISASALTPNTTVSVRGTIAFSRVTRFLTPQEMIRDNQRRQQKNRSPINKPYTTITIKNPVLVRPDPNAPMTINERYMEECFYTKNPQPGQAPDTARYYNLDNKSPRLPHIYEFRKNPDGTLDSTHLVEVAPKAELDNGLDVVLVLRIYKPNGFNNCGVALDSIIVQGEARYYSGGATAALAGMGYTIDKTLTDEEREAAAQQSAATAAPAMPMDDTPDITQPMPAAPVAAPAPGTDYYASAAPAPSAPNPYQNAFQAATGTPNPAMAPTPMTAAPTMAPAPVAAPAPMPAAPVAAPAPAAPVASEPWTCSCGAVNTGNFCNNCGGKKPVVGVNGYANANAVGQTPSGIVFDPNDNNRNY